jgi:ABC-type molybdate transport system substrate-binding protein
VKPALAAGLLLLALTACRGDEDERTQLRVLAASSLIEAFDTLEATYETSTPTSTWCSRTTPRPPWPHR